MSSRGPGITKFDDKGLNELKNELRRLWDAIRKTTPISPPEPEIPPQIELLQESDPTVSPEEAEVLPGKVIGLSVSNYSLYTDPTTGLKLASVKLVWDDLDEDVDIYEITWEE